MEEKQVHIEKLHQALILMINMVQSQAHTEKHLTNTRASGSDEALRLVPPIQMSLEKAIEFIQDDELVEVTPKSIRLRKKILDSKERERAARASMKN